MASVLLALSLAACSMQSFPTTAVGGVIDYAPETGIQVLRGPWERYEGILDERQLASVAPRYVEAVLASRPFARAENPEGDRTYRLRVAVEGDRVERPWVLVLPLSQRSIRVFIDGVDRSTEARSINWSSDAKELSILIQVPAGKPGLDSARLNPGVILFGQAVPTEEFRIFAGSVSLLFVGMFLLEGLMIFFLFNLWTKNQEFFAFALFLLAESLRYCVNNSALLPFEYSVPIDSDLAQALTFALQFAALSWFFTALLRERSKLPAWIAIVPIVLLGATEILFERELFLIHSMLLVYYETLLLSVFAFLLLFAIRGSTRARWLLAAPLFLLLEAPLRFFMPNDLNANFLYSPSAAILFAIVTTVALFRKIRKSFSASEVLSGYVSEVADTMKRFIPIEFLEALNKKDVVDLRLGDHVKKDMTIFFSDIRGFTELSERLTVEENFAFINSYLSRVVPIIKQNGGFIDKYIGDAIMGLFPGLLGPDQAIRSAIEMQGKIIEYNGHRAKMGYRPVSMGVGLHTGSLMLGVVGVEDRMENTVISDSVNLASRLQAITKAFNISLAISEQAFKAIEDPGAYTYRFIGKVKVKGKAAPLSVFEIFDGIEPALFDRKMKANTFFEQGMLSYYQKDFSGAMYYFKRVLDTMPEDGAASFYLETCMNRAAL